MRKGNYVTPTLSDLYHLREQIDLDLSASVEALRRRDHAIGSECASLDDVGKLLFWIRKQPGSMMEDEARFVDEGAVANVLRIVALASGFLGMSGFLSNGQGLVNVFIFFLLFVLLQVFFCIISIWVMFRSVIGTPPVILPVNPMKHLFSRMLPDRRFYRECQSVIRLLALRYGQEMGAVFTIGAVIGFFLVLSTSGFGFVWGSTFSLSDSVVMGLTDIVSYPWSSMVPSAMVSGEAIEISRHQQGVTRLGTAEIEITRQWWPFLIMSMSVYALLPRVVLWGASKYFYRRTMRSSFVDYPGSERVLARMTSPVVTTQAGTPDSDELSEMCEVGELGPEVVLLDWSGALEASNADQFIEIKGVPIERTIAAGMGSLSDDAAQGRRITEMKPRRLVVVVKAWEPPMADLRDFIASLEGVSRCSIYLMPLANKPISNEIFEDWRRFSREIALDVVDVFALRRD
jgi:hypothetical protein